MGVSFDHRDPGTPEQSWRDAAPWRSAPPLDLDVDRVVVLAAHPDDETLGAGGLLARAASAGIPVSVVVVTDGEGSHPHSPDPAALRRRRREEAVGALHRLAPAARLSFVGVPDRGLREARAEVTEAVAAAIGPQTTDRVLLAAPWWGDGHRDHRVLGEIALALAGAQVAVVGYPIWLWHWGSPADVDTRAWRTLALDARSRAAKELAVAEYASQLHEDPAHPEEGAILHANTRAHFARDVEVFVAPPRAPEVVQNSGHSSAAPRDDAASASDGGECHELHAAGSGAEAPGPGPTIADFDAFHARHDDPWGLESRWYERRKRALLVAALPRERFAATLELGCASGAVTRELAKRSASVVAVDASEVALDRARRRGAPGHVRFERHELPEQWPAGRFDLILLSELAYYWTPARLAAALERIDAAATDDAVLVVCHWRPAIDGAPLTGDAVHAAIAGRRGWRLLSRHREELFTLDVLGRPGVEAAVPE